MNDITVRDFVLFRTEMSIAARLLLGRLVACRTTRGHSVKELSVINGWSESKVRSVLTEVQSKDFVSSFEAPSFDRGRPRIEYRLKLNPEQIRIERYQLGLQIAEQLLGTRVETPNRDLDCFILLVLWLEASEGTLWSCLTSELLGSLGLSVAKVRRAYERLAAEKWLCPPDKEAGVDSSKAHYCLLHLEKFNLLTRQREILLPATIVNVLDSELWARYNNEITSVVARRLTDFSSWLFIRLYNKGVREKGKFIEWIDHARTRTDSDDAPHVTSAFETFSDISDGLIAWSYYLNLFCSLSVVVEHIEKHGFDFLSLAIMHSGKANRFSTVVINHNIA